MNGATARAPGRALLVALGLSLAGAGCEADIPEHPTWAKDVWPIVLSRCVHCHYQVQPGEPVIDAANFDYPVFEDALAAEVVETLATVGLYEIRRGSMPKPPSTPLYDWQIETIARWAKNPQ